MPEISLLHRHIVQPLLCVMEGRLPLRAAGSVALSFFSGCLLLWAAASLHSVVSPVMAHNHRIVEHPELEGPMGIIEIQFLGSLSGGWN